MFRYGNDQQQRQRQQQGQLQRADRTLLVGGAVVGSSPRQRAISPLNDHQQV